MTDAASQSDILEKYIWFTQTGSLDDDYISLANKLGYKAIQSPLLEIEQTHLTLPHNAADYQAVVITSGNTFAALKALNHQFYQLPIYCVGDQTAIAAKKSGFKNVISANADLNTLETILDNDLNASAGDVLYLSGYDITRELIVGDINIERIICYKAQSINMLPDDIKELIRTNQIKALALFSARGGKALGKIFQSREKIHVHPSANPVNLLSQLHSIKALCLSDKVVNSIESMPFEHVRVAASPDRKAMIDMIDLELGANNE